MPLWDLQPFADELASAAVDPTLWVSALDKITDVTGSFGTVLIPNTGGLISNIPFTDRLSGSFEAYVRDGWHLRDERFRCMPLMKKRGVADDLDAFSYDVIKRHPYYQEFLAPHGLRWFAGVRVACGDDLWCLSIQRTIEQGPFSEAEKDQLAQLSTQLSCSVAVAKAVGASSAAGALDAFEISGLPVVLINRQGKIFMANPAAERILVGEIQIVRGRIVASEPSATALMDRCIHDMLWRRGASTPSVPVSFPRAGRRPLLAYPTVLSSTASNALAECQAIVVFVDPDDFSRPAESVLQSVYRLSEAEARLAARMASGQPLEIAADQLGIAKETGRSQLKSIFAKTSVCRQAELVALLAPLLKPRRTTPALQGLQS